MMQIISKWKITWWYDQDLPNEKHFYINANNIREVTKWFNHINHGLNPITKVAFELVDEGKQEGYKND